jgi:FlaA1/EpsC-like NDP-sugar epimerase
MRPLILLIVDLAIILAATLAALFLRENFEVTGTRLAEFFPYLLASLLMAAAIFSLAGLNRSVWRFSGLNDYLRATAAAGATIAGAVGLAFVYNRLEGVARSLPPLQFLTATAFLMAARVLHRVSHDRRHLRKTNAALLKPDTSGRAAKSVLIVGISKLAEAYLQAAAQLAPGQMKVAGLVGRSERHTGRLVATYPVLGTPERLAAILGGLDVHGVTVNCIVIAPGCAPIACRRFLASAFPAPGTKEGWPIPRVRVDACGIAQERPSYTPPSANQGDSIHRMV